MAKIRLTESELKHIIEKIIKEYVRNNTTELELELELETEDDILGLPFTVSVDWDMPASEIVLVKGTYDPEYQVEIEKYISKNYYQILEDLMDKHKEEEEESYLASKEYNPEDYID